MAGEKGPGERLVQGAPFALLPVLLTAFRFASSTLTAFLAVEGVDTSGIDAFFSMYALALPLLLAPFGALVVLTWPVPFRVDPASLVTLALLGVSAVLWAGSRDPELRLLEGPWGALALGVAISSALLAEGFMFDRRLVRLAPSPGPRRGLWALAGGFGAAYLLTSVRLLDLRSLLGGPLPPGLEWELVYAPLLLLVALALAHWFVLALPRARGFTGGLSVLGPPIAFAALGLVLSQGLGGFVFSHLATWGGAYPIFVPTAVSLTLVGFAFGGALSVVLVLRGCMARTTWRLVTAGLFVALFSGILPLGGALVSLSGLAVGIALVARGLAR